MISKIIFRSKDGRELGPQDYIQAFEKFVKENPEHMEALEILLNPPKDFDDAQLKSLRNILDRQPNDLVDKFTEKKPPPGLQ